ncbi:HAMP domain-containing sensor histidine kinase [Paenibacillus sp. CAU 1782]
MLLKQGIKSILLLASLCLFLIAAGSVALYAHLKNADALEKSAAIVNSITVQTSEMMVLLEDFGDEPASFAPQADRLRSMADETGVQLKAASLDGIVYFDSNDASQWATGSSSRRAEPSRLDMTADLHYRLQHTEGGIYTIAFPVVSVNSGMQTGNALFYVPSEKVKEWNHSSASSMPLWLIGCGMIGLIALLFLSAKKMKTHILKPVLTLRDHSETILRGNYDGNAIHDRDDEIGELYSVFDQMRAEIRYLHESRLRQEQAQKELVTNISHDLKTPLAVARAYTELMRVDAASLSAPVVEYIEVMDVHTRKMSALIEDLMLHAMSELGQISVKPEEIYSRELLQDMAESAARFVMAHGILFRPPSSVPDVLIHGDAVRLEQVMGNLIANAIKHTERGGTIAIDIEVDEGKLVTTVSDTGQGISPEDMPFLFHRYYQGSAARGEDLASGAGNGLGLSICKHIIEEHGGTIGFRSEKGKGTAFTFTLPLSG